VGVINTGVLTNEVAATINPPLPNWTGWAPNPNGNGDLYYFRNGSMQTGWHFLLAHNATGTSHTFYFRTADNVPAGGPRGSMVTGWWQIDGGAYHLRRANNAPAGGPRGARLENATAALGATAGSGQYTFNSSGRCTQMATSTRAARVRYDETFGANNVIIRTALLAELDRATSSIRTMYGINLTSSLAEVQRSALLNGSTCPQANDQFCNANCGTANDGSFSNCGNQLNVNPQGHHKSAGRLLRIPDLISNIVYTVRVVGHAICFANASIPHTGTTVLGGGLGGVAAGGTRDTIVTSRHNVGITILIQHELCHNLGALDCNNFCIMNANNVDLNRWCNPCAAAIRNQKW
jgi:hypothetical protein